MNIYVASSWRNEYQESVVQSLRKAGHQVYDFKNPEPGNTGFHWSEVDKQWQDWNKEEYRQNLDHPAAERGFGLDFEAMKKADVFIGVQPFGRSASMEMGWAAGNNKKTILLLDNGEPELMVKMFDHICCRLAEVLLVLDGMKPKVKGEYKGLCNRKACQSPHNVVYFNSSTRKYYCPRCAKMINDYSEIMDGVTLCKKVEGGNE